MRKLLLYLITAFMIIPFVFSVESLIINSEDWRDVYSGTLYGRITGTSTSYLPSEKAGDYIIAPHLDSDVIRVMSSKKLPMKYSYPEELETKGITDFEDIRIDSFNFELLKLLNDSYTNFLVLDDSYGYNAISVAPYVVLENYFVIFVDKTNVNRYLSELRGRDVDNMIIFGIVDRAVRNAFDEFDPEILNDEGDRFRNNVLITEKYRQAKLTKEGIETNQVILTNGEFIEDEIMSGTQPVLFIGQMNVPGAISSYIQNSSITVGVLIGNELIRTAQFIKDTVGISTFVKFGRSSRNPSGVINEVEDLDRFPVPRVTLGMDVIEIKYNTLTSEAMVTIKNTGPISIYLRGTYTIDSSDGNPDNRRRFGDNESQFIESGEQKTFVYKIDRIFSDSDLIAKASVLFGESKYSQEFVLDKELDVEVISYEDTTLIDIIDVVFDEGLGKFKVKVKNLGDVKAFFNLEVTNLVIIDVTQNYGAGEIFSIAPGEEIEILIDTPLTKEDYSLNDIITIVSFYGKSSDALLKRISKDFSLVVISSLRIKEYIPTIIIIVMIILILLELNKKKCPECETKNSKSAKHCKKCGHKLKK